MRNIKNNLLFLSVVSGFLLGLGLLLPYLGILSFLSFFGVALFIFVTTQEKGWKKVFLYSYISGVVSWSFALGAIFLGVLPLDWYGIDSGVLQMVFAVGSLLLTVSVTALGFPIAAFSLRFFYSNTWRDLLVVPSLWVLSEYLGSLVFYVASYGPGSYFGANFSIGWLGYLIASDRVLLQGAYFGGIFALSFTVVFVGTLILKCVQTENISLKKVYIFILCSGIAFWLIAHAVVVSRDGLTLTSDSQTISAAAISRQQPPALTITEEEDERYFNEVYNAIKPLRDVELLVFPEETAFLRSLKDEREGVVLTTFREIGLNGEPPVVIDSTDTRDEDGALRSKVSYYKEGQEIQFGYKQFLLPLGEYLPNIYLSTLRLFGGDELLNTVQNVRGYQPGEINGKGMVKGSRVATRFCAEAMSPELYRKDVLGGAEMLINISSLSWFHGSSIVYEQMKRIARVRAVESGRWYVQSGNMSPAFVLNSYGEVVAETQWSKTEVVQIQVPTRTNRTPYVIFGSKILFIPLYLLFILSVYRYLLIKPHKNKSFRVH